MQTFKIIFVCLFLIFFLINCAGFQPATSSVRYSADLTAMEKKELLNEHNKWRRQVGVPDLVWSWELENVARDWAYKLSSQYGCRIRHSSNSFGENIFWANYPATAKKVIDYWASERFYYDYTTNNCKQGKECGHYTQLIWSDTLEVGCARALCDGREEIWVCNYRPAGNIWGKKPY